MKIKELINEWNKKLKDCGIEESLLKTRVILSDLLGVSKEYLLMNSEEEIMNEVQQDFEIKMQKILEHEPFQYVLGYQEFMKLRFFMEKRCINTETRY